MSYRDPYYPPQAPQRYEQPYRDNDAYDPYYSNNTTTANYPAHPTYDQSGYRDTDMDDEAYPNPSRFQEPRDTSPDATAVSGGEQKERSKYEAAGFPPALRPPKCVATVWFRGRVAKSEFFISSSSFAGTQAPLEYGGRTSTGGCGREGAEDGASVVSAAAPCSLASSS